jgi:protein-S-isoprenylcysteine O-methyltransferase
VHDPILIPAFLLNNGWTYWASHAFGLAEYFISVYAFPCKFNTGFSSRTILTAGRFTAHPVTAFLLASQALRSFGMIHAAQSFSHIVKAVKHDDHTLITHGVYA